MKHEYEGPRGRGAKVSEARSAEDSMASRPQGAFQSQRRSHFTSYLFRKIGQWQASKLKKSYEFKKKGNIGMV